MLYGRAHRRSRLAGFAGSFPDGKLHLVDVGLHLCLGCYAPHSFICGSTHHTANIARHGLGGDGFFFCPLSGQICPTTRTLLCIGQRAAPGLFWADTALTGGVDTGSLSPLCCAAFPVFLNLLAGKLASLLYGEISVLLDGGIGCIGHRPTSIIGGSIAAIPLCGGAFPQLGSAFLLGLRPRLF